MQYSIVRKSECSKYDFGYVLFSPEFFLQDKLVCWKLLEKEHTYLVNNYFSHIKETVNEIDEKVICYDLTDGLPKFLMKALKFQILEAQRKLPKQAILQFQDWVPISKKWGLLKIEKLSSYFQRSF